jgi:hypothetical protein
LLEAQARIVGGRRPWLIAACQKQCNYDDHPHGEILWPSGVHRGEADHQNDKHGREAENDDQSVIHGSP